MTKQQQEIRKAQKESYFYQEISKLFRQITIDESSLNGLFINRVQLSPDGGTVELSLKKSFQRLYCINLQCAQL